MHATHYAPCHRSSLTSIRFVCPCTHPTSPSPAVMIFICQAFYVNARVRSVVTLMCAVLVYVSDVSIYVKVMREAFALEPCYLVSSNPISSCVRSCNLYNINASHLTYHVRTIICVLLVMVSYFLNRSSHVPRFRHAE